MLAPPIHLKFSQLPSQSTLLAILFLLLSSLCCILSCWLSQHLYRQRQPKLDLHISYNCKQFWKYKVCILLQHLWPLHFWLHEKFELPLLFSWGALLWLRSKACWYHWLRSSAACSEIFFNENFGSLLSFNSLQVHVSEQHWSTVMHYVL